MNRIIVDIEPEDDWTTSGYDDIEEYQTNCPYGLLSIYALLIDDKDEIIETECARGYTKSSPTDLGFWLFAQAVDEFLEGVHWESELARGIIKQ